MATDVAGDWLGLLDSRVAQSERGWGERRRLRLAVANVKRKQDHRDRVMQDHLPMEWTSDW